MHRIVITNFITLSFSDYMGYKIHHCHVFKLSYVLLSFPSVFHKIEILHPFVTFSFLLQSVWKLFSFNVVYWDGKYSRLVCMEVICKTEIEFMFRSNLKEKVSIQNEWKIDNRLTFTKKFRSNKSYNSLYPLQLSTSFIASHYSSTALHVHFG